MKQRLHHYVGKMVRLNAELFQKLRIEAKRRGEELENSFLVSEVSRGVHKLICYGANLRIVVSPSDVVLV